ncbi:MAG: MBL fold metallo-hydrolase [Mesorhizobium sp.]|nr:MBL fold metallo-hydrolase [Mesorhizobium sp.]MCO5164125.1 MBL fold metallo-hydrolase [Mesorhizobium sp.]
MTVPTVHKPVSTEFPDAPEAGNLREIADGVLWLRLPLPYEPGHVNSYLIRDGDGWTAVDAGLFDEATCAIWQKVHDRLPGRGITTVLATHWHPDHLGAAGWICETFGASLATSESEYLRGLVVQYMPKDEGDALERDFFLSHGLAPEDTELWVANGRRFMHDTYRLPATYRKLSAGRKLAIDGRTFDILVAGGHSPEEVLLHDAGRGLFFCADQVGPRIAPTMAVQPTDPLGDPLSHFLAGLETIAAACGPDDLFLPGHEAPFRGFHARADELRTFYAWRCDQVVAGCREGSKTATELLTSLFRRRPGPIWIGFLIGETLAYANYLVGKGALERQIENGIVRFAKIRP